MNRAAYDAYTYDFYAFVLDWIRVLKVPYRLTELIPISYLFPYDV